MIDANRACADTEDLPGFAELAVTEVMDAAPADGISGGRDPITSAGNESNG